MMQRINPRQQQILVMLRERGRLTTEEAQEATGFSRPTIYRDFQVIIDGGHAVRIPGGMAVATAELPLRPANTCAHCGQPISSRTAFMVQMDANRKENTCCPHCGMMTLEHHPEATSAMATDFIYGTMVSVRQAVFLAGSRVVLCCLPSVLCFGNAADAASFQAGFGGEIMSFDQLRHFMMHHS